MPQNKDNTASWWAWILYVLGGAVTGHFWAVSHIANQDGAIEQSFTGTVGLAIVGGLGLAVMTARAGKWGLTAFCVGVIAFGASAALWH